MHLAELFARAVGMRVRLLRKRRPRDDDKAPAAARTTRNRFMAPLPKILGNRLLRELRAR